LDRVFSFTANVGNFSYGYFNFTTTVCYAGDGVATDGFFEVVSTCSGGKYYTQNLRPLPQQSRPTRISTDIVYDSNGPQDVGVAAANC